MKTVTSCIKNINLTNTLFIIHFQIAGKISKLFSLLVDSQRKERYVPTWLEEVDIFPQKMHEKLHSFFPIYEFQYCPSKLFCKKNESRNTLLQSDMFWNEWKRTITNYIWIK